MDTRWHEDGLTVGQVAERMRIAASAVRWYADKGLLPCERDGTNQRRFHADVLCRVAMIQAAQQVGLRLAEIRDMLADLPAGRPLTTQDWERLAARLRTILDDRIAELFALVEDMSTPLDDMTLSPAGSPGVSARGR